MTVLSLTFALLFALVHIFIGMLRFLEHTPRSRWLSAAGGVAVAYVFLHILPELSANASTFAETLELDELHAEEAVYTLALIGLAAFYGLERWMKTAPRRSHDGAPGAGAFWLHIGSFAVYNVIIGYLLVHRETPGIVPLLVYGVAMALHFVTSDFGLRDDHKARYDHVARWVLAAAVLGGWTLGMLTHLPELWIGMLFAFLAGGVVLNVLKEELPEERESRFLPFVAGGAGYALLLLAA
ncbi:hypothetical protein [Profundibacterium mesophilum]|uniref:Uncharacterized protein n=1 Tax=Profundibacterium mesophilum KAUST100406-0324 TaxID=1037889 RepID=A0A921TCP4_9RHOB|nr:hypothetical protein [Profundibacterium mesophilum]KAF0675391.1 hypothetical protein PMES_02281 [Profundibacterium mesophilum KAUST100406-0324]